MSNHTKKFSTILLLCLTMILSACGTPGGTNNGGNGAEPSGQNNKPSANDQQNKGNSQEPATKTVSTAFGDVEVPAHPKRVAALSYLGTVLALDVKPIASEQFLLGIPYLDGMIDDVEDVGESFEKLLLLEPDLIITHNPQQEIINKYKQIAPPVSIPYNAFESIQEEMRFFGQVLDKEEEAERWIENFTQQTKDLSAKVQKAIAPGETVSIMQEYDGTVILFGPKSGRGGRIMYEIIGVNPPQPVPDYMLKESYYEFSLEKLSEYMGDYLILTTDAALEQLQADPLWGKLPPIKNKRVFLWTENESWYRDPIAVSKQIQTLVDWIVSAADQ